MGVIRTRAELRAYQVEGAKRIDKHPGCFLQMLMGGGKTVTTLTAYVDLKAEFMVNKALVVSTKNIVTCVWPFEPAEWEHLKHLKVSVIHGTQEQRIKAVWAKADIYCVSRDNLEWLAEYMGDTWPWDWLIFDESDSLKNPASNRFKAIAGGKIAKTKTKPEKRLRGVLKHVYRVTCLSGTPATNGLIDLWAQYYLLDRGYRLGHNITRYRNHWFDYDERKHRYIPKAHALEEISGKVADITYVVEDYSGMPEVVYNKIRVPLCESVQKAFKKFKREKLLELVGTDITAVSAGVLFGKLCQFSNGAVYDEDRGVHEIHDAKLSALEEIIEQAQGHPVLVAYAYQHDKSRIKARIKNAEFLDGKPSTIARWNAGKIPVLVAHPGSCSHGLNLQHGGSELVWFGLTAQLGLYLQMNARLARSGQKNTVFIHLLVAEGTEDDRLVSLIEGKTEEQASFTALVKQMIKDAIS